MMGLEAVLIDSREPAPIQKLKFGGVPVSIAQLEAGDLHAVCSDGAILAIERKTPSDLLGTLRDKRLFPQLAKLREISPWAYLVITGNLQMAANDKAWADSRETGWDWSALQGALLAVQEIGVHILYVHGDLSYEPAIIRLANRERGAMRVPPARDISIIDDAEVIVSSLPGVGAERARALLGACATPAQTLAFLTAETWEGLTVPGIGRGVKRLVRHALGLGDDEALVVVTTTPDVVTEPATAGAAA